ncbi:hypothetical protein AMTRI_Chr08g204180 [Amborella trichopoda]|uniref:ENTH domain-containing protein n=1 Tax=Amborella trichopoda TaxID=13333 RepID=W1PJJ5_AMBTC|nr:epsin-3 [Amborella trichopoda]ERN07836.1 hypothetical protein AMTR_s00012p00192410 [Amborella trichopoda]|eukprot:XP_006846161.1 epsin-3 [Amborella trichopoda]
MSMLSHCSGNRNSMGSPLFKELKKQASFFIKEKVKSARLVLTDVTPAQLLTEEATNVDPWAPDARTMGEISQAAFEVDNYWRIVEILHNRFQIFDRKNWRQSYKALVLLEHLLTHGPESFGLEFQSDKEVIQKMGSFQHIDEKGFNWGLTVRKKSERVLNLLTERNLLKEERQRARKLTRGIQGFGSFTPRTSLSEFGSCRVFAIESYGRCKSYHTDIEDNEDMSYGSHLRSDSSKTNREPASKTCSLDQKPKVFGSVLEDQNEESNALQTSGYGGEVMLEETEAKEISTCLMEMNLKEAASPGESRPLLDYEKENKVNIRIRSSQIWREEDHPFSDADHQTTARLLSVG